MVNKIGLMVVAAAVLGGCAARDVVLEGPQPGYVEDAAARVAAVDWSRAESVEVRLTEYAFDPRNLTFRSGKPYRLQIENVGTGSHTFVSEGFFQSIAAKQLVGGDSAISSPILKTVAVSPKMVRELTFVAVQAGTYRLECTVPLHALFGMVGEIVIQ